MKPTSPYTNPLALVTPPTPTAIRSLDGIVPDHSHSGSSHRTLSSPVRVAGVHPSLTPFRRPQACSSSSCGVVPSSHRPVPPVAPGARDGNLHPLLLLSPSKPEAFGLGSGEFPRRASYTSGPRPRNLGKARRAITPTTEEAKAEIKASSSLPLPTGGKGLLLPCCLSLSRLKLTTTTTPSACGRATTPSPASSSPGLTPRATSLLPSQLYSCPVPPPPPGSLQTRAIEATGLPQQHQPPHNLEHAQNQLLQPSAKLFGGSRHWERSPSEGLSSPSEDERPCKETLQIGECVICMEELVGCVFIPCGHLVCCVRCGQSCPECPLCRQPFSQCIEIHV